MRIGYRANEVKRAIRMNEKRNESSLLEIKATVSKHPSGRNKWEIFEWQNPTFPLIDDGIYKDNVEEFWKGKPVRFAWMNNCVGCFTETLYCLTRCSQRIQIKCNGLQIRRLEETERELGKQI